ncbi:MAG: thioredoxin domain-containing protein, partial [Chloroflexota bacterium]
DVADAQPTVKGVPVGFTDDGHAFIGDLNAPVVIEEYSDFQCPFCSRFSSNTFPGLLDGPIANGEAVLIFYDFPLNFHTEAAAAANAARCAGEQDPVAYWEMHDLLFEEVGAWSINDPSSVFVELAVTLALDVEAFELCVDEFRYEEAINADLLAGQSQGITGTPTFLINGQPFVGAQPLAAFQNAIAVVAGGDSIVTPTPEPVAIEDIEIPPFVMPQPAELNDEYASIIGDPNAPILVVEFTDYQCPFCGRHSSQTAPAIISELVETGRIRYALKDYPLDSIHPLARVSALAARCAGEQEAYWEMHDILFEEQGVWGLQGETAVSAGINMSRYAEQLGLDQASFDACMTEERYADEIEANLNEGVALGVNGTPAFFIGGYPLSGAQPFDVFELVVSNLEEGTLEELYRTSYDQQVEQYRQQLAQQQAQPTPTPAGPVDVPLAADDPFIGDADAPIVIVEYTDFQCPFCSRHFDETFPQIKEAYIDSGLVKYVFKDFPLDFHLQAGDASEAARCAFDQGAYLDMHHILFDNQAEWSNRNDAVDLFIGYADELGLEMESFAECLTSDQYAQRVSDSLAEGYQLGVSGTPSFFINGNLLVGAQPFNVFQQGIDTLLADGE